MTLKRQWKVSHLETTVANGDINQKYDSILLTAGGFVVYLLKQPMSS